jgi:hypothetical protein
MPDFASHISLLQMLAQSHTDIPLPYTIPYENSSNLIGFEDGSHMKLWGTVPGQGRVFLRQLIGATLYREAQEHNLQTSYSTRKVFADFVPILWTWRQRRLLT